MTQNTISEVFRCAVAETRINDRVKRALTSVLAAALLFLLLALLNSSPAKAEFGFLTAWGNGGMGFGRMDYVASVAVSPDGHIYVTDTYNNRILKFDSSGSFIAKWGKFGTGNGQFINPNGITVDSSGNVYVADTLNNRIQKFDSNGNFLIEWGSDGGDRGSFRNPSDIAVTLNDDVVVADSGNDRIQKFNSKGTFKVMWGWGVEDGSDEFQICSSNRCREGIWGTGDGQFDSPYGVAADSDGNVYVSDASNYRIQKFDSGGDFQRMWGWGVKDGSMKFQVCRHRCSGGKKGSGDGQFDNPSGISIDLDGSAYVADANNNRIQKFNPDSSFQRMWGWGVNNGSDEFQVCTRRCHEGARGSGLGQFDVPMGVVANSNGNVYIADTINNRIQKFDSDGLFLVKWGSDRTGEGQFDPPIGIATDPYDFVYVADARNNRIQKFNSSGAFQFMWGRGVLDESNEFQICTSSCQIGRTGPGDGHLDHPAGVAADLHGNVYVADTMNERIQKFSSGGSFLRMWGWGVRDGSDEFQICRRRCQKGRDIGHKDGGKLDQPYGVAVGVNGDVYVADSDNYRIQKFNSKGTFKVMWGWGVKDGSMKFQVCHHRCSGGKEGSGDGQFEKPRGLTVDTSRNVYVADSLNHRIQKFKPADDGGYVYDTQWGELGEENGQFNYPFSLDADSSGNIFVADAYNNRIQKFDSEGNFLYKWGKLGATPGRFNSPYGVAADSDGNVYVSDTSNYRIQKFGELPAGAPPKPPPPQPPPPPQASPTATKPKSLGSDAYKKACNLKLTSPKIKVGMSPAAEISARRKRLSSKKAKQIFSKGLKGYIDWGRVNGRKVVCKKIKMTILEKRGKRYYVPGTKIRVSKKRLRVRSFYKKVVRFLRGKKVGKLGQRRIKGKRRTRVSFKEYRSSKRRNNALKNLRKKRYRGSFIVIYTAEVDGTTVKRTVAL